jgi:hypothetical protein
VLWPLLMGCANRHVERAAQNQRATSAPGGSTRPAARGIVEADQMRKATRVAASTTVASDRSRSPVSAGAASRLASSGSLLASASWSSPRTAITRAKIGQVDEVADLGEGLDRFARNPVEKVGRVPKAFGQRTPRFEVVHAVRLLGHVAVQVLDLGFQLDRVDGSHAGTPSCLKFCWVDAGRSARAMSGIDGRAGQGTGERRGSWPAGVVTPLWASGGVHLDGDGHPVGDDVVDRRARA